MKACLWNLESLISELEMIVKMIDDGDGEPTHFRQQNLMAAASENRPLMITFFSVTLLKFSFFIWKYISNIDDANNSPLNAADPDNYIYNDALSSNLPSSYFNPESFNDAHFNGDPIPQTANLSVTFE